MTFWRTLNIPFADDAVWLSAIETWIGRHAASTFSWRRENAVRTAERGPGLSESALSQREHFGDASITTA